MGMNSLRVEQVSQIWNASMPMNRRRCLKPPVCARSNNVKWIGEIEPENEIDQLTCQAPSTDLRVPAGTLPPPLRHAITH